MTHPSKEILGGFGSPLATMLLAAVLALFLTPVAKALAFKYGAVDDPTRDERRIHTRVLPRWGGLAIYVAIAASVLIMFPVRSLGTPAYMLGIMGVVTGLVIFGALDDLKQYSAKAQLIVLLGAGLLIQFIHSAHGPAVQIHSLGLFGHVWVLGWIAYPATAIYIFVVTKTMDTIDGVDGLASGIALISSATLTIIAWYGKFPPAAILAASIGGAALGFLFHNRHPAKIIMGTGGAYVLGFMLACVSIVGGFKTVVSISILIPIGAFAIPIFDAFFVIIRRKLSGQPISQPDKRHIHHTLMAKGLSQGQTVWVLCLVAAAMSALLLAVITSYVHP